MKRARTLTALLGALAGMAWVTADYASAEDASMSIKKMMGENFAGLQRILAALISSDYAAVPKELDVIRDHAAELVSAVPPSAESDRDRFLVYAYNLEGHASDLKSIVNALIEHDRASRSGQPLPADPLREAAAAHYGGMVATCVSCHNRFRRRITP